VEFYLGGVLSPRLQVSSANALIARHNVPHGRNQLVHEVEIGLIWNIALCTENLVVSSLHQLLFKLCGMLDVRLLLNLYKKQAIAVCGAIFGKASCKLKFPSPLGVSVLVLCGTLLSYFGQGGAVG